MRCGIFTCLALVSWSLGWSSSANASVLLYDASLVNRPGDQSWLVYADNAVLPGTSINQTVIPGVGTRLTDEQSQRFRRILQHRSLQRIVQKRQLPDIGSASRILDRVCLACPFRIAREFESSRVQYDGVHRGPSGNRAGFLGRSHLSSERFPSVYSG